MIASIRNFALVSTIVPALALTGCSEGMLDGPIVIDFQNSEGMLDGPIVIDFQNFPNNGQVHLVTNSTDPLPEPDPVPQPEPQPQDVSLRLNWNANPTEENIQYYEVNYGEAANQIDYFYTKTMNEAVFDLNAPEVDIDMSDLAGINGNDVCFTVKAFNDSSESDPSDAACAAV